jgi:hypothetical protein
MDSVICGVAGVSSLGGPPLRRGDPFLRQQGFSGPARPCTQPAYTNTGSLDLVYT